MTARNDQFALIRPVFKSGLWVPRWVTIDTSGHLLRQDSLLDVGTGVDYHDFSAAADGALTIAFGDAMGHGL